MSEFQPGDVIEIDTPLGFSYVQITHLHPSYPEVVRGLPGHFAETQYDPTELATHPGVFTAMVPLGDAISMGNLTGRKVGTAALREEDQNFPTFRMAIHDKKGAVAYWWFWDGEGLYFDESPISNIEHYPLREVLTVSAFLKLIEAV